MVTSTETVNETDLDEGNHDRFAHYARKGDIVESNVTGKPIIALCGKVWVPNRDPNRFKVCPTCKEIYAQIKNREVG
tara:strand:- start:718 stop:948 length:231 start_codon:yes stop_codon:yes gene_type:complete